MGSSASKASRAASKLPGNAINAARKYPTRTPPNTNTQPTRPNSEGRLGPTLQSNTTASEPRDQATQLDASDLDPALDERLKSLGPVQPNPTRSNSSTFHSHRPGAGLSSNTARPSSSDPSLTSSHFQPSASTPQQSIFPASSPSSFSSPSNPTQRSNPAVSLLTARYRLAAEAEREFSRTGKSSAEGRQFLDVCTIRQILLLRDEKGVEAGQIERSLGLREGVVASLGARGLVGVGS
ncbi:hypothetical protein PZA11_003256 [Diplocarpon coronariae]